MFVFIVMDILGVETAITSTSLYLSIKTALGRASTVSARPIGEVCQGAEESIQSLFRRRIIRDIIDVPLGID